MLFQVYGDNAMYQWIGWVAVFICLILANEVARRSKAGGILCFLVIPAILTVYFAAIYICAGMGMEWALTNPTYVHMNGWFHYAKLYAATAGCIGFMVLKYRWGSIGKSHWFKAYPFVIVAINILIAVVSDFESAVNAWGTTWVSSEGITLMGGWHNVLNGLAGIVNIFCMTGWWGIYVSRDKKDMLWPDMTWVYIIAYDIWNFCYTYNRANTLALWCMFAQVFPMFQDYSVFSTDSVNDPAVNFAVAALALVVNVAALAYIIYRAKKLGVNPYKKEVFVGTRDYEKALSRADLSSEA